MLPIFVNRENQMCLASAFDQLAEVREFSFRVQPDRVGRLDVSKRHRHFSHRRVCEPLGTAHFSDLGAATLALLLNFSLHVFLPPARSHSFIRSVCDLPTAGFPSPADTWPPCAARY